MKRLIYIALSLLIPALGFGQGLYSIDREVSFDKVVATAGGGEALYAVQVNDQDSFELTVWDEIGLIDHGTISLLPKQGTNAGGDFDVLDAQIMGNDLYIIGSYGVDKRPTKAVYVLKWDGSSWTDISQGISTNAIPVKFVPTGNALYIIGDFGTANVLEFKDNEWVTKGSRLTNLATDYIIDGTEYLGKIYCSGQFTRGTTTKYSLATFDGSKWEAVANPPFLGESYHFSKVGNYLLLSGQTGNQSDYLKRYDGETWDDLSNGLSDVNVLKFSDLESNGDFTCLVGEFESVATGTKSNFLLKVGNGQWTIGEQTHDIDNKLSLLKWRNALYLYGTFDYQGIQNLGELSPNDAVLRGRVYFDKNENCVLDADEGGLGIVKMTLEPAGKTFFTDSRGYYEIPAPLGAYTISFATTVSQEFGCGRIATGTIDSRLGYNLPDLNVITKPNVVDLNLHASWLNGWRITPSTFNELRLSAHNSGSVVIKNATLRLRIGDWWNSPNMSPTPDDFVDGEYIWKVKDLPVDGEFNITINGVTKDELDQYTKYMFYGEVEAPQTDADGTSNLETGTIETGEKLDPISKQSSLGHWYTPDVDEVTYQIRMENITNDVVNRLKVQDTLDVDLVPTYAWDYTDLGSTMKTDVKTVVMPNGDWRYVYTWTSEDANLQPPKTEPDGSNVGYVEIKFALHDVSRKVGTELCNQAKVYFENYEPVKTNEVCTQARPLSNRGPVKEANVHVYPNPTAGVLHIVNRLGEAQPYQVINQLGQVKAQGSLKSFESLELDMSNWASGVYIIRVNDTQSFQIMRY